MPKRRFGRVWLVGVAFLGSLVAMELALQLGALLVSRVAGPRTIASGEGAVILCVGDSHTYGLPLPAEESYPAQLQQALDESQGPGTYRVANLGVPSVNSDFVLNRLARQIAQLDPVMIVVWVGINNLWNAVELDREHDGVADRMASLTRWSRLARLASMTFHRTVGHDYDPAARGGWFEGEAAPSGVAEGMPRLPNPGPGLERDLVAMGELARSHGIPIVFIAYPFRNQEAISASIERAAGRLGAPLVETSRDFVRARAAGHSQEALVDQRAGPHPSKLLYAYIVESLLPVVEESLAAWYGTGPNGES